jgi:hypothetical protein
LPGGLQGDHREHGADALTLLLGDSSDAQIGKRWGRGKPCGEGARC